MRAKQSYGACNGGRTGTLGRATCTIKGGYDSSGALSGVRQWTRTRQVTRRIQGGENADLLQEIREVLKLLPHLKMVWLKVKAHLKAPP